MNSVCACVYACARVHHICSVGIVRCEEEEDVKLCVGDRFDGGRASRGSGRILVRMTCGRCGCHCQPPPVCLGGRSGARLIHTFTPPSEVAG
uniref:Secreted protein n=1 Tax=Elaeophora elaphi TaxID=1147741 RepID=A0A0R3RGT3_9BILA